MENLSFFSNGMFFIVLLVFLYAFYYFIRYLRTHIENEKVRAALKIIEDIVGSVVSNVSQTYVKDVRINGKLLEADAEEAKELARDQIKKLLTDQVKTTLVKSIGNLEDYLDCKIEQSVAANKINPIRADTIKKNIISTLMTNLKP